MDLVGAADRTPAGLDGISFAPTLFGREQPERPFLYREFPSYGGWQSVRIGNWKGVRQNLKPRAKNAAPAKLTTELFDLKADIGETTDVSSQQPAIVAAIEFVMREQHTASAEFPIPAIDKP
jgi:arylsulfatase